MNNFVYDLNNIKTSEISDMILQKEGGTFLLTITYKVTRNNGKIEQIRFPKVILPFINFPPLIELDANNYNGPILFESMSADFGFGFLNISGNCKGERIITTVIKEADPKEMTISDLEKIVGYPIKLVKDK